ncbi:MAG: FAD:protein FMN transferase [Tissierellia bacterium]|nr:FAD:protein FMN transferase [Tissierellia bacterium]
MKKGLTLLALWGLIFLVACQNPAQEEGEAREDWQPYTFTFYDTFDTIVDVTVYTQSEEEAKTYEDYVHQRFLDLHQLFTSFEDVEGVTNVKTLNDRAGGGPLQVDPLLFDLLETSLKRQEDLSSKVNIAMGSLTQTWHQYREGHIQGSLSQDLEGAKAEAQLPPQEELEEAARHMDPSKIILDKDQLTVEILDPKIKLDVGAVAKGYATEVVAQELEAMGLKSGFISAGGNVRTIGRPMDGREAFAIGLQNPQAIRDPQGGHDNVLAVLEVQDLSVVSSGDYQRFYQVEGKIYHHIIDPDSLYPGEHFQATTVVTKDSGLGDFLSTAIFLMPYEEGRALIDSLDGVEAYWLDREGHAFMTPGLEAMLKFK